MVDFNAAAREASRTAGIATWSATCVARGEQKDDESGEIAMQYLRTAHVSALALTYGNSQAVAVLVQLFWLREARTAIPMSSAFLDLRAPFDLREIKDFDLDVRRLKKSFPRRSPGDFQPYRERFCRLLGIESEQACGCSTDAVREESWRSQHLPARLHA